MKVERCMGASVFLTLDSFRQYVYAHISLGVNLRISDPRMTSGMGALKMASRCVLSAVAISQCHQA